MTYRVAWLSPLTPASGVGTFSNAILREFPTAFQDERIDITVFYVNHETLYRCRHRSVRIGESAEFHEILTLFDLIIYNIGNNREHHEPIFELLRIYPGIVICHDFVYQHYLADISLRRGRSFSSFAALLLKHGDASAADYLSRSRITSRTGQIRYSPWDTELSVTQPMSEAILALGSALVVHSQFARRYVERSFNGPVLTLGMPYDQKPSIPTLDAAVWKRSITTKPVFRLMSFGHIQSTKCIDLALAALAASPVLRKRVRYTVAGFVGDPVYFRRLQEMVENFHLEGVVSFETGVNERRLQDLMRDADIFLNLRRPNTEGSSVSLIEQLETGKPTVVLGSGCYGEVPGDAVVKAPSDASTDDIRAALERLIGDPDSMPTIGAAGRAYARSWSCASYGQALLSFAFEHRSLLEKRAQALAISAIARQPADQDDWTRELTRARASFRYLHASVIATDPAVILTKTADDLGRYVASVIFGVLNSPALDRALICFFARLDATAAYWACVRFAIIAEATFGDDAEARERLKSLAPCYDPEFWTVLEALPPRQHMTAAMLILAKRTPTQDDFTTVALDDNDGFPKRIRTRDLIERLGITEGGALQKLGSMSKGCSPSLDQALPWINESFECEVGEPAFRANAGLSGFYAMESDHAWTRGTQGFLGLKLRGEVVRIEALVHHIDASPEQPCAISMSHDDAVADITVRDADLHWLTLRVPVPLDILWLRFSTTRAARPKNGHDDRPLGVCFRRLRVSFEQQADVIDPASTLRRFIDNGGKWAARRLGRDEADERPDVARSTG